MKVVVIGAGVVGSGLAWRLSQRGAEVTLIERGHPAYGTSGTSFAWYNANSKRPEDYFRLNVAGMDAHHALRAELGNAPWMYEGGNLVWTTPGDGADAAAVEDRLEARLAELQNWNYPARWISRDEATSLEPGVCFDESIERMVFYPSEGWIDGPQFAAAMATLAAESGATMRFAAEVTGIERTDGRVSGVQLANGEHIAADYVVNCAGPWAGHVAEMAGRTLPMAPTVGFIARVTGVPHGAISRILHAPTVHIRPDGNGLLALHHGDADTGVTNGDAPQQWAQELLHRLQSYLPVAKDARVSRWSVATRPIPADGRTSAGAVAALPGYAEIVTHSAVTLGALLPRLIADEIVTGEVSPLLANFRPERFANE